MAAYARRAGGVIVSRADAGRVRAVMVCRADVRWVRGCGGMVRRADA